MHKNLHYFFQLTDLPFSKLKKVTDVKTRHVFVNTLNRGSQYQESYYLDIKNSKICRLFANEKKKQMNCLAKIFEKSTSCVTFLFLIISKRYFIVRLIIVVWNTFKQCSFMFFVLFREEDRKFDMKYFFYLFRKVVIVSLTIKLALQLTKMVV